MAWSGCFCQVACGLELCEHEHHPGESTCGDDSHDHHHDDENGEDPQESGCEHPEPSDRTLPDPPQSDARTIGLIQEVGEVVWPSVESAAILVRGVPPDHPALRDQVSLARLCCFLI